MGWYSHDATICVNPCRDLVGLKSNQEKNAAPVVGWDHEIGWLFEYPSIIEVSVCLIFQNDFGQLRIQDI
jgi:hypothetical protein